jgi:hypothetical protein
MEYVSNKAFKCGNDGPRDAKEKKSLCDADDFDTAHWNDDSSNIEDSNCWITIYFYKTNATMTH